MELVFDIETDGLLEKVSKIHCLVIKNMESGAVLCYHTGLPENPHHEAVATGLRMLQEANLIVGHNVIKYDIPVIQKFYPWFKPKGTIRDTIVCSRLIWSDIKANDMILWKKNPDKFPGQMIGRHSLESWGYRLGNLKGTYGKTTDWAEFTPEMLTYCIQDVELTGDLWNMMTSKVYSQEAISLEHEFQDVIFKMERLGFAFDRPKAIELYTKLCKRRLELEADLQKAFPPWTIETLFTPKVNNKARGYVKGVPAIKSKTVVFSPSSRDHISNRLTALYGWKPLEFTEGGAKAKVDEDVLNELPWPEAKLLTEYLMLQKRIGQLCEGDQAWMKLEQDGRIHGQVVTNGTLTGRCTHSRPNMAQVPSIKNSKGVVPYGADCRALFIVPTGYKLVGVDASGLELRTLAHYMARYDGGQYARDVLTGDIHTANQKAAGIETRDQAKRWIYAYLYGAGDAMLGSIVGKGADVGKRLKAQFLAKTPALKKLQDAIQESVRNNGYLKGIDGRHLPIRSAHAALNTLLQSAGALIVKKATVLLYQDMEESGFKFGRDYGFVAHVHDEIQSQVKEYLVDIYGKKAVGAMQRAGEHFKFRVPISGEFKVGANWAECH